MQSGDLHSFNSIYIKYIEKLYENNDQNKCCRHMLVNVLKQNFIETYVQKIHHKYKTDKLTLIQTDNGATSTNLSITTLNDSDVNRVFGCAIYKLKLKYTRLNKSATINKINEVKNWLDDMSVFVQDMINDNDCIWLYYAKRDLIRYRGYFTLIHPMYIKDFSNIIQFLKKWINNGNDNNDFAIPDKTIVKHLIK